jgi:hypothetical protein
MARLRKMRTSHRYSRVGSGRKVSGMGVFLGRKQWHQEFASRRLSDGGSGSH